MIRASGSPFDMIVAADCVYHEGELVRGFCHCSGSVAINIVEQLSLIELFEPLAATLRLLCADKTTVYIVYVKRFKKVSKFVKLIKRKGFSVERMRIPDDVLVACAAKYGSRTPSDASADWSICLEPGSWTDFKCSRISGELSKVTALRLVLGPS